MVVVTRCSAGTLVVVTLALSGCYVTAQAWHQNDLFNNRRPVEIALSDPSVSARAHLGLKESQEILAFATKEGLTTGDVYRYYVDTKGPVVSYIVQAAHRDRLEFVTWWFPVVGRVPYLGYFSLADRDRMAKALTAEGYDVSKAGAGAFSSLGWFEDPLFTSMVERRPGDLAHLLFHELTHRTWWASGSVEFNENLAEYTAHKLTIAYLGASGRTPELAQYLAHQEDLRLFRGWVLAVMEELRRVYEQPTLSLDARLLRKKEILAAFRAPQRRPKFTQGDLIGDSDWNNASLLAAKLYAPDLSRFEAAQACVGDSRVMALLHALEPFRRSSDPFKALDGLCAGKE